MYCVGCGAFVEEGSTFCTSCGRPMAPQAGAGAQVGAGVQGEVQPTMTMPASDFQQAGAMPGEAGRRVDAVPAAGFAPPMGAVGTAGTPQMVQAGQAQAKGGLPKGAIIAIAVVAVLAVAGIAFALLRGGDGGHDGGTATYSIEATESDDAEDATDSSEDGSDEAESSDGKSDADDASADAAKSDPAAEQAKREEEARQAALDAGKEVFTGQVIVTTMAQRAHDRVPDLHDFDNYDKPYVVLELGTTMQVQANSGDGMGMRTGDCDSIALPLGQFDAYDGQTITIAAYPSDLWFYSDVTGALAPIHADVAELIAPLDGSAPTASASTASTSDGDYVLADSDSRYYSRSELEAMDNLTLYHARNEIFARHGRQFKNPDLQEFFNSKPWYSGTVAPEDFSEQWLNDYEDQNAKLMLQIEQERNSPYLS